MSDKKYRCLIVDDEPIARKIIAAYLAKLPNLENAGECKNAFEALDLLSLDGSIEIVFLDINMPNLNGISMVKLLPRKVQIIFTTAYSEFAIESYELNAVDYLLKPFSFERFAKAVYKTMERLRDISFLQSKVDNMQEETTLFIKSEGESYPIVVNEIVYCEAMKNYTKIVMSSGKSYLPLIALSKLEEELTLLNVNFLRIHRSFLISNKFISAIGANYVMIENHKIPIGSQYKAFFLSKIGMK
jgi:DNA-binding LytR/AlgR family response regulator